MSDNVFQIYRDNLLKELAHVVKPTNLVVERSGELGTDLEHGMTKDGEKVVLKMPTFHVDMSWLSDSEASVLNKPALDRFLKVVQGLGISRGILEGLPQFISEMKNIVSTESPINVEESHSQLISRAQMIRVFYNLVMQEEGSPAGLLFERYLALIFGGKVVEATQEKGEENIADVIFPGQTLISLKMLQKGGKIKGSIRNLIKTLKLHGDEVTYIICEKPNAKDPVVRFYQFTFTRDNIMKLPGVAGEGATALLTAYEAGDEKWQGDDVRRLKPGMQIKLQELITGDFDGGQIQDGIDLSTTMEKTQMILEAVNTKFEGLLLQLQKLVEDVDELTYSVGDKEQTKAKATKTKKSAEKTDQAAGDLKQKTN